MRQRKVLYVLAGLIASFAIWVAFSEFDYICRGHYDFFDGRPTRCDLGYFSPWPSRAHVLGVGFALAGLLVVIGRLTSRPR